MHLDEVQSTLILAAVFDDGSFHLTASGSGRHASSVDCARAGSLRGKRCLRSTGGRSVRTLSCHLLFAFIDRRVAALLLRGPPARRAVKTRVGEVAFVWGCAKASYQLQLAQPRGAAPHVGCHISIKVAGAEQAEVVQGWHGGEA